MESGHADGSHASDRCWAWCTQQRSARLPTCQFPAASWCVTGYLKSYSPKGASRSPRVLDDVGYREALLAKLVEEAGEASHASATDLPGELADVLEVLRALTAVADMSWEQMLKLADEKRSRSGGWEKRIFLESVE